MVKKFINIIEKDMHGCIIKTERIPFLPSRYKTLHDIEEYVDSFLPIGKDMKFSSVDYSKDNKQHLLKSMSSRRGSIDWSVDFLKVPIDSAFGDLPYSDVSFVAVLHSGGLGYMPDINCVLSIISILPIAKSFLLLAIDFFDALWRPYKLLRRKASIRYDASFINGTILMSNRWSLGFISNIEFHFKHIIERNIMKSLGYKRIGNFWDSGDGYNRMPDEILLD